MIEWDERGPCDGPRDCGGTLRGCAVCWPDNSDIAEQNAVCIGCGKPIKRYGSDGLWFTDRYDCTEGRVHRAR